MTATETLLQEPVIQALGWALVHFIWQGALVGALAAVALRALRTSAADVRYVVAAIALALMATLPAVTAVQTWRAARAEAGPTNIVAPDTQPAVPAAAAAATEASPATLAGGCPADACASASSISGPERWFPALVLVWMAGVLFLALRLAGGWICVHRMKTRGATAADAALQRAVARLTRTLHIARPVTLLQSPGVDVPTVIGWFKPVILLPMSALAGLSPLQVEAILAHELAHIRRHDYLVNLLQSLLETLLFYHPAVWWLSKRIRIEREHCCDDLAVSLCGDPVVYARALADLEELRSDQTQLVMAANGGALVERVRRLLAAPATHAGRGPAWLAAAAALLLMLGIVSGPIGRHSVEAAAVSSSEDRPLTLARMIGMIIHVVQNVDDLVQEAPLPPVPPAAPVAPLPPASSSEMPAPAAPAALPAVPAPPAPPMPSVESSEMSQSSSGNFTWSRDGKKVSIDYRGAFTLNDTDSDVATMAPGSYLRIRDGGWFKNRSVEFRADAQGNITRRFFVVNDERPFEPEGREWLAKVLPRFIRDSGFAAKDRVARFLKKGGVPAVLDEIALIESDHARKTYYSELMKQTPLDAATARRVLEQAGRQIKSDYELASLLTAAADKLLVDDATREAFFAAARSIESDYEMRRALTAGLKRSPASPATIGGILETSRELDSDYEAATLLIDVVKSHAIEGQLRGPFFSALQTIESSYEKARVLQALLRRQDLSADTLAEALNHAGRIGSGHETAQVLTLAARSYAITGAAREAYIRAAERLGDYEKNRSLAALARAER